jgi:D-amino-acid oxidase
VRIEGEDDPVVKARWLINAAGLGAQAVSASIEGMDAARIPPLHLAKGSYCSYARRAPFSRLIYPLPEPGGLGVHLTLDLGGQAKFGPNVEWVEAIDYAVDDRHIAPFAAAIRRWWPRVDEEALVPSYAGIRPKITPPGAAAGDFRIDGPADHGLPGVIALYGIESPGLTSSLAIAERVRVLVDADT